MPAGAGLGFTLHNGESSSTSGSGASIPPSGSEDPGSPFIPTQIASMRWLVVDSIVGADTDPISLLSDSSAHGADATQGTALNQPILKVEVVNNHTVARFDGNNDSLTLGTALGAPTSFDQYLVFRPNALNSFACGTGLILGDTNFGAVEVMASAQLRSYIRNDAGEYGYGLTYHNAFAVERWQYVRISYTDGDHQPKVWVNGERFAWQVVVNTATNLNTTPVEYRLGALGAYPASYFSGDIAAFGFAPENLSLANIKSMDNYLATFINEILRQVFIFSDSIPNGDGLGETAAWHLRDNLDPTVMRVHNLSVSGSCISPGNGHTGLLADVATAFVGYTVRANDIIIFGEYVNERDLQSGDSTLIYNANRDLGLALRAAFPAAKLLAMKDFHTFAGIQTASDAVATNYALFSDGYIDFNDSDLLASANAGDGTHLHDSAGNQKWADIASARIALI